jgi:hypothetical protein
MKVTYLYYNRSIKTILDTPKIASPIEIVEPLCTKNFTPRISALLRSMALDPLSEASTQSKGQTYLDHPGSQLPHGRARDVQHVGQEEQGRDLSSQLGRAGARHQAAAMAAQTLGCRRCRSAEGQWVPVADPLPSLEPQPSATSAPQPTAANLHTSTAALPLLPSNVVASLSRVVLFPITFSTINMNHTFI